MKFCCKTEYTEIPGINDSEESPNTQVHVSQTSWFWRCKWKRSCAISIPLLLAIFPIICKMILLVAWYSAKFKSTNCDHKETTGTSGNKTISVHVHVLMTDGFTVAIRGLIGVLRIIEYGLLTHGYITFVRWCCCNTEKAEQLKEELENSAKSCGAVVLGLMLFLYLLVELAVPTLGIVTEYMHTADIRCDEEIANIFYAYCGLNFIHYLLDFTVRISMIAMTRVVSRVWYISNDKAVHKGPISDKPMKETAGYVQNLEDDYQSDGKLVKACNKIFQTWFILPWIIYYIAASLEAEYVLEPWLDSTHADSTHANTTLYPKMYYLAYNLNQLVTLLVPYFCAKQMEACHKTRVRRMAKKISKKKFGNMMNISRNEHYDFHPRIIGTGILFDISNPIYFLFLLLTFFLTIGTDLMKLEVPVHVH